MESLRKRSSLERFFDVVLQLLHRPQLGGILRVFLAVLVLFFLSTAFRGCKSDPKVAVLEFEKPFSANLLSIHESGGLLRVNLAQGQSSEGERKGVRLTDCLVGAFSPKSGRHLTLKSEPEVTLPRGIPIYSRVLAISRMAVVCTKGHQAVIFWEHGLPARFVIAGEDEFRALADLDGKTRDAVRNCPQVSWLKLADDLEVTNYMRLTGEQLLEISKQ